MPYTTLFQLAHRVTVITGAAGGLGRCMAEGLAAFGAHIVAVDRNHEGLTETVARIVEVGGQAEALAMDVADPLAAGPALEEIGRRHGHLDILINNAGIATPKHRLHELALEDWDRVLDVNLRGAFLVTRAVLPWMLAQGRGSIINIASIAGLVGVSPELGAVAANYAASKAGLIGLTRAIAAEYGRDGIRANAIAPGWHLGTGLGREHHRSPQEQQQMRRFLEDHTPVGRTGEPSELVGLAVYLASDASTFVTGQVIAHDGGWVAW